MCCVCVCVQFSVRPEHNSLHNRAACASAAAAAAGALYALLPLWLLLALAQSFILRPPRAHSARLRLLLLPIELHCV